MLFVLALVTFWVQNRFLSSFLPWRFPLTAISLEHPPTTCVLQLREVSNEPATAAEAEQWLGQINVERLQRSERHMHDLRERMARAKLSAKLL